MDLSVSGELENHGIAELERTNLALADDHPHVTVDQFPAPSQLRDGAVDRAEKDLEIAATAKHHAARQRRDQFGILRQRLHKRPDVVLL